MDWHRFNMNEVQYYCTTRRVDFDCLPLSYQINCIIEILYYYQIGEFLVEDIKDFYHRLKIPNPRSDGIRKPSSQQISKVLEKMSNIQCVGSERFQIRDADLSIYANEIKYGYDQKRIVTGV